MWETPHKPIRALNMPKNRVNPCNVLFLTSKGMSGCDQYSYIVPPRWNSGASCGFNTQVYFETQLLFESYCELSLWLIPYVSPHKWCKHFGRTVYNRSRTETLLITLCLELSELTKAHDHLHLLTRPSTPALKYKEFKSNTAGLHLLNDVTLVSEAFSPNLTPVPCPSYIPAPRIQLERKGLENYCLGTGTKTELVKQMPPLSVPHHLNIVNDVYWAAVSQQVSS